MQSEVRRPRVWKGDLTCSASTCSDGSLVAARANVGWLSLTVVTLTWDPWLLCRAKGKPSAGEGQHPCQHLDM